MQTMKTVLMRDNRVHVEEVPVPEPGTGQVLVKSRACGICGSDLHITLHAQEIFEFFKEVGTLEPDRSTDGMAISLGHEFCAEVVSYGPHTRRQLAPGQRVTSVPFLVTEQGQLGVGVNPDVYGAYSEYFLLNEDLLLPVPDGLPDEAVAMTEPMAVGLHAVNHGTVGVDEVALVAGCGSIGLACIVALKRQGVKTIIASDPREGNWALARELGATHVVNPVRQDEIRLAAELAGAEGVVILECVGLPSMIPDFIRRAPAKARIVFAGLHTSEVAFAPALAMAKELTVKYSFYYEPEEFAECLQALADGDVAWQGLCTGKVGINGVPAAFDELMQPNNHVKVVVEPWRAGALRPA